MAESSCVFGFTAHTANGVKEVPASLDRATPDAH